MLKIGYGPYRIGTTGSAVQPFQVKGRSGIDQLHVFEVQEQLSSKFHAPSYFSSCVTILSEDFDGFRIRIGRHFSKNSPTYQEGPKLTNHLKIDA